MTEASARLALPYILPGQAQKELFHNQALALIDGMLHAAAEGAPLPAPPEAPATGQCWIVAGAATGDWIGKDDALAIWTHGGWRFAAPVPGMLVWDKAARLWLHWNGSAWTSGELPARRLVIEGKQVVRERQPAVPSPSGGTIIDTEARSAIGWLIVALRSHGLIE